MRLLPIGILFAASVVAHAAGASPADDEQAIRKVEKALCDAFRIGDADAIARHEDATYTLTNSNGEVTTRADDIADAKKGVRFTEFRNHDTTIRLYGDAAIVLGITSIRGVSQGKAFARDFQFTDTWIRRKDGWKIAASHASRIGTPPGSD
jgi:ketosteroid isomerase-like protein